MTSVVASRLGIFAAHTCRHRGTGGRADRSTAASAMDDGSMARQARARSHYTTSYSGGNAGGRQHIEAIKLSGQREHDPLHLDNLTCAKQASSLEWLASSTMCMCSSLRLAAVQVLGYILLPPEAEYTDTCMSPWLTHSLDKSTSTRHNIVSPSGHLQLRRNVLLMLVRCYAVSLDTATYSICRARSRWLELKLVTPASLRHCLS